MKSIPGFEGYFINKKGEAFTNRVFKGNPKGELRKLPLLVIGKEGHRCPAYRVTQSGSRIIRKVSRLVAITHIPNPNNYPNVLHNDNDTFNNWYKNLRWGTQKENIKQMMDEGRGNHVRGIKHPRAKCTIKVCKRIKKLYKTGKYSQKELGKKFGVHQNAVSRIIRGLTYNSKNR